MRVISDLKTNEYNTDQVRLHAQGQFKIVFRDTLAQIFMLKLSVLASFAPILGHRRRCHITHLHLSLNSPSDNSCFVLRSHITPSARQVDNIPITVGDPKELLEGITLSLLNATQSTRLDFLAVSGHANSAEFIGSSTMTTWLL